MTVDDVDSFSYFLSSKCHSCDKKKQKMDPLSERKRLFTVAYATKISDKYLDQIDQDTIELLTNIKYNKIETNVMYSEKLELIITQLDNEFLIDI